MKPFTSAQERALLTYIKRMYFPFVLREPQLSSTGGRVSAALWAHADPATAVLVKNNLADQSQLWQRHAPIICHLSVIAPCLVWSLSLHQHPGISGAYFPSAD